MCPVQAGVGTAQSRSASQRVVAQEPERGFRFVETARRLREHALVWGEDFLLTCL